MSDDLTQTPTPASFSETPQGDRPEWLPDKFKDAEQMARSYAELEARQAGTPPEAPVVPVAPVAPEAPVVPTGPAGQIPAAPEAPAGMDLSAYTQEVMSTGDLSAESIAKLGTDYGFTPEVIQAYVGGQKAQLQLTLQETYKSVGGEEAYGQLIGWAASNYSEAEKSAFNSAVASGDPGVRDLALQGLKARAGTVASPEAGMHQVRQSPQGGQGIAPFSGEAEHIRAIGNPLYKTDSAFRAEVRDRLKASVQAGTIKL